MAPIEGDPAAGEMVFFGYSAKGRFTKEVSIQTVAADGKITRAEILEGPFPSMIHDFAVTKNWIDHHESVWEPWVKAAQS